MQIYITKNNQQLGPFEEAEVLEMLKSGQFTTEDFACHQGASQWQPLKVLFPTLSQNAPTNNAATVSSQEYSNQAVVNWARQSLPQVVEVKLKGNSLGFKILLGICYTILAVVFLGIPLMIYISAIATLLAEGWNEKVFAGLVGGTVFLAILGALFLGIYFLLKLTRRKFAKVISPEGVETRNGQKFGWENLHFLNYKKVDAKVRPYNLIVSMIRATMLASVEKVTVEMVFANGTAVVPPLIENQPQILALLNSIPAQRRDEGTVRQ